MKYALLILWIAAGAVMGQATGDYTLTRKTASGYEAKIVTPENGKVLGWDSSGNPVNVTPVTSLTWEAISGKPSSFAPSVHTHAIADTTGLQAALDGKMASNGLNTALAAAPITSLRSVRAAGYNQLIAPTSKLWRIVEKFRRDTINSGAGTTFNNRFRAACFGDSVAAVPTDQFAGYWGYGGWDISLQGWASEGGASPSDTNPGNYPSWLASGTGVFTLYDEWARAPGGLVRNIIAGRTGANHVESTGALAQLANSVYVQYLASDGYGSFKLQYKTNGAGAWTDATTVTVTAGGGSQASGVVTSDNDAVGVETLSLAVFTLPTADAYHYRILATAGHSRLCSTWLNAGAFNAGPVAGLNAVTGALTVSYAQGGRGLPSHFSQIPAAVLNQALGQLDPHVIIYKSANEWSLAGYQTHWPTFAGRVMAAAPNATLVVCGMHPRGAAPEYFAAGDIAVDDYLREWCSTTPGAIFVDVRQNFPPYSEGANTIDDLWSDGIHIYDTNGPNFGGGSSYVNNLVFNTLKPAFDAWTTTNDISGPGKNASNVLPTMPRSVRLYSGSTPNNLQSKIAFETHPRHSSALVMRPAHAFYNSGTQSFERESGFRVRSFRETVSPGGVAIRTNSSDAMTIGTNPGGPLQGVVWGISDSNGANAGRSTSGYRMRSVWGVYGVNSGLTLEARDDSSANHRLFGMDINSTDAAAGTNLWSWNIGATPPSYLVNGAQTTGATTIPVDTGTVAIPAGAQVRFGTTQFWHLVTTGVTGAGNLVIAPGLTANAADNAVVTVIVSPQVTYHGRVNDSNVTNITHDEPIAVTNIHTAIGGVAGTGTRPRYNFDAPGYADAAAAAADSNLPSGALYFDEATRVGRIKP